jgi:hypothetical protein
MPYQELRKVTKSVTPFTANHIGFFAQLLTAKAHFVIATTALWSVPKTWW